MSEDISPKSNQEKGEELNGLMSDLAGRQIDRRTFIAKASALGLTMTTIGMLVAACGGGSDTGGGAASGGGAESAADTAAAPEGATDLFTYRDIYDTASIDPAIWPTTHDGQLVDCINEGLIAFKPGTFDVVNCLAETFEASEDNLEFSFKLKEGIQFHGGYGEVTAEDVKYSYERIAGLTEPKLESPYQGDWAALKEVKVVDTYSGVIVMKEPFAPLMRTTLPAIAGKVLSKKAVEEKGEDYGTSPIGTGPYEFVSWTPKEKTVLKKFADYSGANSEYAAPAVFEQIEILFIEEDTTAANALQAGDVDYGFLGEATVDQISGAGLPVQEQASLNYNFLAISEANAPLDDINVRKAVREAIDVDGIIAAVYNGKHTRAKAIIPENMGIGYWADAPSYGPDPAKAQEYLAASGLTDVTLKLTTTTSETDKAAAEIIQANLKEAGITVEIDLQDSGAFYEIPGNGGGGKDRQLVYSGYTSLPDPSWSIVWFTQPQIGQWNWCDWAPDSFQQKFDEAQKSFDDAVRDQLYVDMQKEWDESATMAWISFPNFYYGGQPWVKPVLNPNGWISLWSTGVA